MRFVRDHSLSLFCLSAGLILAAGAMPLEEGNWFDLWLSLGSGLATVGLWGLLSGPLKERNKPEKDPE